jgi:two-component system, chemotaxis family, chemotaxis protein CheY
MSMKESLRVLVVDDMAGSRGVIVNALESLGIKQVSWEDNAEAALSSILKFPVHLVLADYNMPGKDGLDLLAAIRSNDQTKRTGFILVSGTADSQVVNRGRQLGMNNFIAKPCTPDKIKAAIESLVGRL